MGHMFYKYSRAELGMMATLFLHPKHFYKRVHTYLVLYGYKPDVCKYRTSNYVYWTFNSTLAHCMQRVSNFGLGILTS